MLLTLFIIFFIILAAGVAAELIWPRRNMAFKVIATALIGAALFMFLIYLFWTIATNFGLA